MSPETGNRFVSEHCFFFFSPPLITQPTMFIWWSVGGAWPPGLKPKPVILYPKLSSFFVADPGWRARPRCQVNNSADIETNYQWSISIHQFVFMSAACGRTPGTWWGPTLAGRGCEQLADRFQHGPLFLSTTAARTSLLLCRCLAAIGHKFPQPPC